MNERIRELADKIWAEEYWTKPNTDKLLPAQLNRFAELIVQECAQHALDFNTNIQSLPDKVMRANLYRVLDYIKDRMGVK